MCGAGFNCEVGYHGKLRTEEVLRVPEGNIRTMVCSAMYKDMCEAMIQGDDEEW